MSPISRIVTTLACLAAALSVHAQVHVYPVSDEHAATCRRNAPGFHADGKTFLCYAGHFMRPTVRMFDHATGSWSDERVVSDFSSKDYHDYPVMIRGGDDRLHMFVAVHNTVLDYYRSPDPLSIDGEWEHRVFDDGVKATYPFPIAVGDSIYCFFRTGHAYGGSLNYVKSDDNGETWSQSIFHPESRR